jgi:hypothetical protein
MVWEFRRLADNEKRSKPSFAALGLAARIPIYGFRAATGVVSLVCRLTHGINRNKNSANGSLTTGSNICKIVLSKKASGYASTPAVEEDVSSSAPAPSNTFPEKFGALALVRPAFVWFSSAVLLFTALAKLFSAAHPVPVLLLSDPVFSFASRLTIFRIAACVELLTILAFLLTSSYVIRLTLIAWLSSLFLVYHLGLFLIHPYQRYCPCLGTIGQALGLSDRTVSGLTFLLALVMLLGAASILARPPISASRE